MISHHCCDFLKHRWTDWDADGKIKLKDTQPQGLQSHQWRYQPKRITAGVTHHRSFSRDSYTSNLTARLLTMARRSQPLRC